MSSTSSSNESFVDPAQVKIPFGQVRAPRREQRPLLAGKLKYGTHVQCLVVMVSSHASCSGRPYTMGRGHKSEVRSGGEGAFFPDLHILR